MRRHTIVNLIFILVIDRQKPLLTWNLIFQRKSSPRWLPCVALTCSQFTRFKNFCSLRPVWCLINANQKSWEKFHRLSVCVVMLCFTYSMVHPGTPCTTATTWGNCHNDAICTAFSSYQSQLGEYVIEDLDIYIFVRTFDSF